MTDTRFILVDGAPGTGTVRLAQALAIQYEAHGRSLQHLRPGEPGHPLRRAWAPAAYASAEAFAEALVLQWQNFAIRAGTDTTPWLCAGAWLEAPRTLHAAGAVDIGAAHALAGRLFAALEPLAPALVHLGGARPDPLGDGAFGGLAAHRTLLNAGRLDADEVLGEALDFLALPRREVILEDSLAARLVGTYGEPGGRAVELRCVDAGLTVDGLPGAAARPLLPAPDGRMIVAGIDLELRPELDAKGRPAGLLARTTEAELADLPQFLPRRIGS